MLEVATGVTTLQLSITLMFFACSDLVDEDIGLLPRQPGSQAISVHSSLLPGRQECVEMFRRLKAKQSPLEALNIDIKARIGRKSSARIHQLLEVHVIERDVDSAADSGLKSYSTGTDTNALYEVHYNDVSTQAAIALAVDMPELSEYGSDASESDDANPESREADLPPAKPNCNAVIMNLPVESEEVDQESKLNQLKLWREACWFIDFFRPVDERKLIPEE